MDSRPESARQEIAEHGLSQSCTASDSIVVVQSAKRLIPLFTAAVLIVATSAHAQQTSPKLPSDLPDPEELTLPPLPLGTPKSAPAPDWQVWRAFHRSLDSYQRESPARLHSILVERVGLTSSEVSIVDTAGTMYLDELAQIEDQAREEISKRFTLDERSHGPLLAAMRSNFKFARSAVIPATTPDGRLVSEVLAGEGYYARLEKSRESVFRAHWESLAESIGLYKLVVGLEQYIKEEVAPGLRVAKQMKRVPADHPIYKRLLPPVGYLIMRPTPTTTCTFTSEPA